MIALSDSIFEDPCVPVPVCFSDLFSALLCLFSIPGGQSPCTRASLPAGSWAASASGRHLQEEREGRWEYIFFPRSFPALGPVTASLHDNSSS